MRRQGWLLLPALAALALVGGSAALVGAELRYRFPQDPLIVLVICGAIPLLIAPVVGVVRRQRREQQEAPAGGLSGT